MGYMAKIVLDCEPKYYAKICREIGEYFLNVEKHGFCLDKQQILMELEKEPRICDVSIRSIQSLLLTDVDTLQDEGKIDDDFIGEIRRIYRHRLLFEVPSIAYVFVGRIPKKIKAFLTGKTHIISFKDCDEAITWISNRV